MQQTVKSKSFLSAEICILGLLATLYVPLLWHWVDGWLNKNISIQHEYFSHGLLGIPFAAYLVWESRSQWKKLTPTLSWLALPLLAAAAIFYISGIPDLLNLSFPLLLAGILLALKGQSGFSLYAFPWVLVLLSTPTQLPYLIEPYVLPLQSFIAGVAGFILQQFDVNVFVDGIYLYVNDQLVEVAPHCAGLKMLFTSLYMGLILAFWTGLSRSRLRTGLFFVGIIGISVTGNIVRNAALTFFHGAHMEQAFEWLHESWGGDLYSAAMLGLLVVLIRLLEQLVPATLKIDQPAEKAAIAGTHSYDALPPADGSAHPTSQPSAPPEPTRPDYF